MVLAGRREHMRTFTYHAPASLRISTDAGGAIGGLESPASGVGQALHGQGAAHMEIASLCRRNVITVSESDGLIAAADVMRTRHVGYLVVTRPGVADVAPEPVGVLTDRDIVIKVVALQANPAALTVGDVMTRQPVVVAESATINDALGAMRRIGVRRLPVIGTRGQLVGVVSLDDAIQALADELGAVAGSIRNEQRFESTLHQGS